MTGPKRVTDKQIAANRANAKKCTGPRTAAGKERSRWNALKHGILATSVIPPSMEPFEMPGTFEALLDALRSHYSPVGPIEGMMVEIIAACYWRLARLFCAEAGAAARAARAAAERTVPGDDPDPELDRAALPGRDDLFAFSRYEAQLQRQLHRALFALGRGGGGHP